MEYRKFGKTGLSPSILGFGMMRMKKKADGTFDEDWTIKTLRYAIDHGLSYVDTAYNYGESERITGLCLQDGYREKVTLATKLPVFRLTCPEDFDKYLDEELERLQTDHIDCYLLHAMNRDRWENLVLKYDVLASAEKAKKAGKIRYFGFSFHDNFDVFQQILNGYDKWDFCQIQLNYLDRNYQAGLKGLRLAHEKGLAVVIMEPLRGGYLANVPQDVAELLPKGPVESALHYLWNLPEVNVVLSGMGEMEQVVQNLSLAEKAHAGMLSAEEIAAIEAAGDKLREHVTVPCTGCDYCNICPNEIAIPEIFRLFNRQQTTGDYYGARDAYKALDSKNGQSCVNCGLCVQQCPQQIPIPEKLKEIHDEFY